MIADTLRLISRTSGPATVSEHVLLGLVRTSEHDTVGQLFADRNVTYERAYDAVQAVINAYLQSR